MKQSLRQSMAWLHTWAGLVPGWVLYVIFVFGTAAFFQHEIDAWMRPELPAETRVTPRALAAVDALLRTRAAGAESWSVSLPAARGGSGLELSWQMPGADRGHGRREGPRVTLDPETGAEIPVRETRGGFFLYRFHFDLHFMSVMWARYLVCVAALAMLVAILSGVVTHKKIFTDFFMLRLRKGQRSWLDAHNAAAVLALPFHLMITYTGLATLLFTLMPWAISANFPDRQAFYAATFPQGPEREASGEPAPVAPIGRMIAAARQHWGGALPTYISVTSPGDRAGVATLYTARSHWGEGRPDSVYLDAATATQLPSTPSHPGGATATHRVMVDLHTGWFAGYGLRWLYFLSGLGGVAMAATGLCLWCVKRRARLPDPARPHFGFRLVERLNIGFISGAPIGIAAYFLANRLLPTTLPGHADWEINALFIAWGGTLVWAFLRPARRAWLETLAAATALYAAIPLVNAATTTRGVIPSLLAGDRTFAVFDLMMLALAAGFAFTGWTLARHKPRAMPARKRRDEEAMA